SPRALLAASPRVAALYLVDPNPAQLALTCVKWRLRQTAAPEERLALLGHAPMLAPARREQLAAEVRGLGLPGEALGPVDFVAEVGPDHAGRYERVFAALRQLPAGCADELSAVLRLRDPVEQARRVDPATTLGRQLDAALDEAMALP